MENQTNKIGLLNSFQLKIIAATAMFIDHLAYVFFDNAFYLRVTGRLAFPIFAFFIVQGYKHTRNLKKYELRLLIFALIAQIPFALAFNTEFYQPNVIFTLLLGVLAVQAYDKGEGMIRWIIPLVLAVACELTHADHGAFGVFMIMIFFALKPMWLKLVCVALLNISIPIYRYLQYGSINEYALIYLYYCIPLVLIYLYNGKKGMSNKFSKWFFYIFYPLHLLIIALIKYFIY